jgi:hypothetical protein
MTDHELPDSERDESGPSAGTDTGNAAETTNADETLADIATDADDEPGKGAD